MKHSHSNVTHLWCAFNQPILSPVMHSITSKTCFSTQVVVAMLKRNCFILSALQLWMHLGSLEITQEAGVSFSL